VYYINKTTLQLELYSDRKIVVHVVCASYNVVCAMLS